LEKEKRRLANDAMDHREFIKWIKQIEGQAQVICEPSGGYERRFIQALVGAEIKVSLVPANRVRAFARAAGQDRYDRCASTLCFWRGDAASNGHDIEAGARTAARIGESAPAFESLAGDGTKSRRALG